MGVSIWAELKAGLIQSLRTGPNFINRWVTVSAFHVLVTQQQPWLPTWHSVRLHKRNSCPRGQIFLPDGFSHLNRYHDLSLLSVPPALSLLPLVHMSLSPPLKPRLYLARRQ